MQISIQKIGPFFYVVINGNAYNKVFPEYDSAVTSEEYRHFKELVDGINLNEKCMPDYKLKTKKRIH